MVRRAAFAVVFSSALPLSASIFHRGGVHSTAYLYCALLLITYYQDLS